MSPIPPRAPLMLRSVFISDVHPGFKGCRAGFLLEFLRRVECEQLYMVGDIIDLRSLERTFFWPQQHNDFIRTLLEAVHETADGRGLLVLHGDEFDGVIRASPFLESVGNRAYALVLRLNRHVNNVRARLGYPYWSVASFLKHKVRNAVKYISNFERAVAFEARRRGVDGIVCGHIHRSQVSDLDGVLYCNDGDWVENCTALVEDAEGRLSLLRWTEDVEVLAGDAPLPAAALGQAA